MTSNALSGKRQDHVVIMARGLSSRMGSPKGLVRLSDDDRPLLLRIAELYLEMGAPVLVVALREVASAYGDILGRRPGVVILPAESGGGTARTLAIAWSAIGEKCTHLWAHPVDLPLVRPETLTLLRQRSLAAPGLVIRPEFGDCPGHPVVLPCAALGALDSSLKEREGMKAQGLLGTEGDMKDWLSPELLNACGSGLEQTVVSDSGVIRDFDEPSSING